MIIMLIYKILTHSRQSCKSVYFLYFNVCNTEEWINKFYLSTRAFIACGVYSLITSVVPNELNQLLLEY